MSRLGQGDLSLRTCRVGEVWVRDVTAEPAFRPRIRLSAGCQLQEVPASETLPTGVRGFGIAALGGQLRWGSATGPAIGDLSFPKG